MSETTQNTSAVGTTRKPLEGLFVYARIDSFGTDLLVYSFGDSKWSSPEEIKKALNDEGFRYEDKRVVINGRAQPAGIRILNRDDPAIMATLGAKLIIPKSVQYYTPNSTSMIRWEMQQGDKAAYITKSQDRGTAADYIDFTAAVLDRQGINYTKTDAPSLVVEGKNDLIAIIKSGAEFPHARDEAKLREYDNAFREITKLGGRGR